MFIIIQDLQGAKECSALWVQRERFSAFGHTFGVRVDGAAPRGLWWRLRLWTRLRREGRRGFAPKVLKVLKFDGLSGRGLWYRPAGDEYKVSVTGLAFYVIWHDKHSADWLAALASPFPAAPDFPLCRGKNKTPRNTLFISRTTISTDYSAPVEVLHRTSKWGEARHLACPLRRFPFAAPPNCGGGKGTGFIGEV